MQERMTSPMNATVKVGRAAQLLNLTEQDVRWQIGQNKLAAVRGEGENAWAIAIADLPLEAQMRYWRESAVKELGKQARKEGFDLPGYEQRYKQIGMKALIAKHEAALTVIGLQETIGRGINAKLPALADRYNTSATTLLRWAKRYREMGLAGLARDGRDDAGKPRSMCLEARRFIFCQYLNPVRRTQDTILDKLRDYVDELGADACAECPFNPASENHAALIQTEYAEFYPPCGEAGHGLRIPTGRHAVNRVVESITPEEKMYMREGGRKAWEAKFMVKGTRAKPNQVNEAWFGDHHQFDVFALDDKGKPVRAWLTVWYDIGAGDIAGWCISTNPNSETITVALTHGIGAKLENGEMRGSPCAIYVDNGKDYRGHRFEGGEIVEYSQGKLNDELFAKKGVLQLLHIEAYHAKPYHGWVKPVERWFKTLEEKYCRELPGYCGGSPEARPENFERQLQWLVETGQLLTIDELADVFLNQILPAYNNTPHKGYGNEKPADRLRSLPWARIDKPSGVMLAMLKQEKETRTASTQGIRFKNVLYWHEEMRHLAGQEVTILYHRDDHRSITVLDRKGQFLCEAEPKEHLKMIGEDQEKVAAHVAVQKKQEKELRRMITARGVPLPGKRASGNMWYEALDTSIKGNLTSIQAEKAVKAREKTREARRRREEGTDEAANATREMLRAIGDRVLAGQ